ncbi:MAG: hypothetical protein AAB284_00670, partial [Chloroflexota bacterium]
GRAGGQAPGEPAGTLSDAQLIALARESHAEAFELLYATYKVPTISKRPTSWRPLPGSRRRFTRGPIDFAVC